LVIAALAAAALLPSAAAAEGPNPPWPQLLPAFPVGDQHQPGPVRHCRRGRMRCVTATMRRMERMQNRLGCDHKAVFATTYLTLTGVLRETMTRDRRFFRDRRYLAFQIAHFSNYWFAMLRNVEAGRPVPEAWRIATETAAHGEVNAAQDMLLGINAHVQRDMPYVVADLGLVEPSGRSRKRDHDRGNDVLNAAYQRVVDAVEARYDPMLATTNPDSVVLDDIGGLEMVKGWREGVWRNAERLVNAKTPEEHARVVESIETNAAAWARMIAGPQQPGYRAQRDAYCRDRIGA
jgi:hypothetical protein